MTRPEPLPPILGADPFSVTEARAVGVSAARLRHPSLHIPTKGVRAVAVPDTIDGVARSLVKVLPGPWAFSHLTAARLHGLPLPTTWSPDERIHVICPSDRTRVRRTGVIGHRGLESREVTLVSGMPVTALLPTWLDLATLLRVDDLVVAADVVARRVPDAPAVIGDLLAARPGLRGRRRLLPASRLLRAESASPMETRTRLAFVRGGLPEPELNAPIYDSAGEWVATGDFVWRKERVLVEFEGDQHRTDRRQWQADLARQRTLEALGWRVIRLTARDLAPDRLPATLALVARALAR